MDNKPTLLIMAAGLGSRYKGDKQIDPMTSENEIIMDFSLYDAHKAGFEDAVIIIRKEMEDAFTELIENGAGKYMNIQLAFQDMTDIFGINLEDLATGENLKIAQERTRPWGTAHAVLSARDKIKGPFAVINADDYYGPTGFQHIYDFLTAIAEENIEDTFAMVAYRLDKTLSENGSVSRGVCDVSSDSLLEGITERTKIERLTDGQIAFTEDDGNTWTNLGPDTPVSMNFWGFPGKMMDILSDGFSQALTDILSSDPAKGEYYLPMAVDKLLNEGKAKVKVLYSSDQWYGVTNREDKSGVQNALQSMKDKGLYPDKLWK